MVIFSTLFLALLGTFLMRQPLRAKLLRNAH